MEYASTPGHSHLPAIAYTPNAAGSGNVRESRGVSELETSLTGTDRSAPRSSTRMTGSSLGVSRPPSGDPYRRLSARGAGRGYVSPEMALADGWRDDGDEGEDGVEVGHVEAGGCAELYGGGNGNGNGNGKRGSKESGDLEPIEEEGGGSRGGDMAVCSGRGERSGG